MTANYTQMICRCSR